MADSTDKPDGISDSAMAEIRRREQRRATKALQEQLETQAKSAGFASLEDAFKALAKVKDTPEPKVEPKPEPKVESKPDEATLAELTKARNELKRLEGRATAAEQEAAAAKQALEDKDTEHGLRELALRSGCTDPDFALHALRKDCAGKTEAELQKFDEKAWFENQKKERPYLFGQQAPVVTTDTKPATTGTTKDAPHTPPKPDAVSGNNSDAAKVDARKMKPDEFAEYLSKFGLTNPAQA